MTWFKVDDKFHTSRKIKNIPMRQRYAAVGVWTIAGSWCSQELTDGFVPDAMLKEWAVNPKIPQLLVENGLWYRGDGGFVFRSWSDYNPTKAQKIADREASAERMKDSRERKKAEAAAREVANENVALQRPPSFSESVAAPRPVPTRKREEQAREAESAAPVVPGPGNDSFNDSKNTDDAFTRFCEALPKPPRTGLAQVRMKWQAACVEHQGWRVLEAAKAYGKKFESGPDGIKYAKQAMAFLDSDEFDECLPHPMQAYRGMDLEKWLDMVTEQRDTGAVYCYAGGETFFPRLPDNYLKLSDAEKATEMAIAKDAWFREHRDEHLKNLRIRYGVITDVA